MKTDGMGHSPSPLMPRRYVYRSKHGPGRYVFRFQQNLDGWWQGYLVVQSGLATPPSGASHNCRAEAAARDTRHVAFTEPVESFKAARKLAAFWADAAEKCVQPTGRYRHRIGRWIEDSTHD